MLGQRGDRTLPEEEDSTMPKPRLTTAQLLEEVSALRQQNAALQATFAEQRRLAQELEEARDYAQGIIDTVREPLVILTSELRVLSASRAFYQMFQTTPGETEQQFLYALGNQQWDIPALRQLLEDLLPHNSYINDFEVTHTFPRLGQRTMLLNARRIARDHPPAQLILLAIEDVTELQRAAQLLQHRAEWFTVTLTSIGDAVIATDTSAALLFMNPEAERLTGWTLAEALGRDITEVLTLISEETRQVIENPIKRVLREGIVLGLANHTLLIRRDGREIPIADSGAPIRSADGTLHGVVMVFRDITERAELEHELVQAKDAAEAADRTKREFLATMSHELRTPLGVIVGYTDLLIEDTFGTLTEEMRGILQRVRKNAAELLDLIIAVLEVSQLAAGRLHVQVHEVRLSVLLEELKAETREVWESSPLAFTWQAVSELPVLWTDAGKLKTVLKNLIGNAVKFTPQGHITVRAQRREDGVEICVTDTGIGIPGEALATIFEPFRQVERAGQGDPRGTGLGLHIVKQLMELLGGTVAVESALGKGATFRVWLPGSMKATTSAGEDRAG
jgi:PAS domain S-box-containing protein